MSILIKGMEMPTEGMVITIYKLNGQFYASVHGTELCHLISIPPHGRLIDADKMEKEVCSGCKWREHKYENCIDCALANAPIVMEAEDK